ncbi:pyrimidine 5'-nucleotidase [Cladophialophora carrionii CBS 160.54]|uniref:Pyrimidine 5'-nucleotidase n=1 Tax=Cladophialophora carrionii CBS 160.54 TaxID=1279043 RepID=V9DIU0_9EURO|nr:pyrimidine 5'-nucleotidase [Cladophialophora carrionii CBS 160.54]ETI26785.1 pyrimidine 5'-nucleotidase [Cladophialophora carrionii CBS 160.54]
MGSIHIHPSARPSAEPPAGADTDNDADVTGHHDTRAVFFFDIDNCLYAKSRKVHDHMARLINQYFTTHLDVTAEEATHLHQKYYQDYGLAIEGLARFHKIDPLDFNREVDDALPLDELLEPHPETRALLQRFDPAKVKLWLFTNAHVTHGRRVVRLLGIDDLFEGITYCDYARVPLVPKPLPEMFAKAEREAGVSVHTPAVYFVDDSFLNCRAAYARGWTNTVHLVEKGVPEPAEKASKYQISHLSQLLDLFPELLKTDT